MAKLQTEKEKYGVSVAARIDTQMAARIAEKAEKLGISYAQMIGLLIAKGFEQESPIATDCSSRLEELELRYKESIALFLHQISNDEHIHLQYIEIFKSIRDGQSAK